MNMEHSERGRYVTDQVQLWIENDGDHITTARTLAAMDNGRLRAYLTHAIRTAERTTAPWHVAQELAPNDWDRVDWDGIRRALTGVE